MGCCGEHRKLIAKDGSLALADRPTRPVPIKPVDQCALCAEKHLATAYALAQEGSYSGVNRARVIGELVCCQWHLYGEHKELAAKVRDIRHLIQHRRDSEVNWSPVLAEINEICSRDASAAT